MKIISKILDYLPVVFFILFSFIGLVFIADHNHIDIPNPVVFFLLVIIMNWRITLVTLFFLSLMGVANLYYKFSNKK
jgi:hypothetical protein